MPNFPINLLCSKTCEEKERGKGKGKGGREKYGNSESHWTWSSQLMTLPNRCGLAFVAIFSHLVTGELLGERDWIACTICVVGTVISNPSDLGCVEVAHCKGAETLTHVRVSRGCCSPLNPLP